MDKKNEKGFQPIQTTTEKIEPIEKTIQKRFTFPPTTTPATIKKWVPEKGFGFLKLNDGREIFCHVNELCSHLKPNRGQEPSQTKVNIKNINATTKGLCAETVMCNECAKPEIWELQETGPEVFGVRELKPVCISHPNQYLECPIPQETIIRANEQFSKAKQKKQLWETTILREEFFQIFGEPISIKIISDNKIILNYENGEKVITPEDAMNSQHWEVTSTGNWHDTANQIKAEFIIKSNPNIKTYKAIAHISKIPEIYNSLQLLPEKTQEEIILYLKNKIPQPRIFAKEKLETVLKNQNKEINDLLSEIVQLQAPGESYISGNTRKTQLYEGLSPDERRGGFYYTGNVTTYNLIVGARKKAKSSGWGSDFWGSDFIGGNSFFINSKEGTETLNKNKNEFIKELINDRRNQLKKIFNYHKPINIKDDKRLFPHGTENWLNTYNETWDDLMQKTEKEWMEKEVKQIIEQRENWEELQLAINKLIELQKGIEDIRYLAIKHGIDIKQITNNSQIHWADPDIDTIEKIKQSIQSLSPYLEHLNNYVKESIAKKENERKELERIEQERIQKEAEMENAQRQAEIEEFGTSGKYLKIAQQLAEKAIQKMGTKRAIQLFEETVNAPYGRARRQQDILKYIGNEDNYQEPYTDFYSLQRASEVDTILNAVLKILDKTEHQTSPQKTNPAKQATKTETTITDDNPLARQLQSLLNKGKKN